MMDITKTKGHRLEVRIVEGVPFEFTVTDISDQFLDGTDNDGRMWQLKRDAIIYWREMPIRAKKGGA